MNIAKTCTNQPRLFGNTLLPLKALHEFMDVELDDIRLHLTRRGEGTPVLLLHGGTGVGADWEHLFPSPPTGLELLAPDLRGHGRSTNPGRTFSVSQIADDIIALLDRLSIDRCHAIGMSLGAKVLLHVATRYPSLLGAMVLVSAAPYYPNSARAIMDQATPNSYDDEQLRIMREKHPFGDDQIFAIWEQLHRFKDSYADVNFTPPQLSEIKARTLIVHGDSDPLYSIDMAIELYRAIPKSALWVIPDGGHVPVFGNQAEQFHRTAVEFLCQEIE